MGAPGQCRFGTKMEWQIQDCSLYVPTLFPICSMYVPIHTLFQEHSHFVIHCSFSVPHLVQNNPGTQGFAHLCSKYVSDEHQPGRARWRHSSFVPTLFPNSFFVPHLFRSISVPILFLICSLLKKAYLLLWHVTVSHPGRWEPFGKPVVLPSLPPSLRHLSIYIICQS